MSVGLTVPGSATAPALSLRPWAPADLPALLAAHRDPVMRERLTGWVGDEAAARRWLAEQEAGWADGSRYCFAVVPAGGEPIGSMVVKVWSGAKSGLAEVGYWTAAGARGQGVAPRALAAVLEWLTGPERPAPLAAVDLLHAVGNTASCRVAEKSGFGLVELLAPFPPDFPEEGHRHRRVLVTLP
ncbi:GNAT family N-acetyltransferase [Kitasatospora sp. NPDC006697]|uniref:GNAT family N-acetyltransferase n=1 Tax=Kitasatospora sp. NPDC006697 TaxID=3364020 RepID=UPI0036CFD1F3